MRWPTRNCCGVRCMPTIGHRWLNSVNCTVCNSFTKLTSARGIPDIRRVRTQRIPPLPVQKKPQVKDQGWASILWHTWQCVHEFPKTFLTPFSWHHRLRQMTMIMSSQIFRGGLSRAQCNDELFEDNLYLRNATNQFRRRDPWSRERAANPEIKA